MKDTLEKSDHWVEVTDRIPDSHSGKFKVRLQNGQEIDAFFYLDKIAWIAFYGEKISHWWDAKHPYERLDNVTHWSEN